MKKSGSCLGSGLKIELITAGSLQASHCTLLSHHLLSWAKEKTNDRTTPLIIHYPFKLEKKARLMRRKEWERGRKTNRCARKTERKKTQMAGWMKGKKKSRKKWGGHRNTKKKFICNINNSSEVLGRTVYFVHDCVSFDRTHSERERMQVPDLPPSVCACAWGTYLLWMEGRQAPVGQRAVCSARRRVGARVRVAAADTRINYSRRKWY